jgi:hypothetical protein
LCKRKKPATKEPLSKHAKPSPASVPPTPDAPTPSPIHDDTHMGDVGGQFGSISEANPTTEAMTNDVVQSDKAPGSSHGHMDDVPAGSSLLWK